MSSKSCPARAHAGARCLRLQARRATHSPRGGDPAAGSIVLSWANFFGQLFNGLVPGALLALISAGLTIIYGTLGVLNLAHGALFMLGGYAGLRRLPGDRLFPGRDRSRGALFVLLVGIVIERRDRPLFLQPARRGPDPGHLRPRHRLRRADALGLRQPVAIGAGAGLGVGRSLTSAS